MVELSYWSGNFQVYEELGLVPDNDVDNPWTRSRSTRSPCSTLTDPVPSFLFPQRPNPNGIPEWGAHVRPPRPRVYWETSLFLLPSYKRCRAIWRFLQRFTYSTTMNSLSHAPRIFDYTRIYAFDSERIRVFYIYIYMHIYFLFSRI